MNNSYNRLLDLVVETGRGTKRATSKQLEADKRREATQKRAEKAIRDARRNAGYTGDDVEPLSNRKDEGAFIDGLKGMLQRFKDRRDAKAEKRVKDRMKIANATPVNKLKDGPKSTSSNIRNSGGATEPSIPHIAPAKSKQGKPRL